MMELRACRKILRMVGELHVRGFQRIRIAPVWRGEHWHCGLVPVSLVLRSHGARELIRDAELTKYYDSTTGRQFFGWTDVAHVTPSRLADVFIERCPRVARAGYGPDWEYAGWFSYLLHQTYPDLLPDAGEGDPQRPAELYCRNSDRLTNIALPPGGEAAPEKQPSIISPDSFSVARGESTMQLLPMPRQAADLDYKRRFSAAEFGVLSIGFRASDMDEKWHYIMMGSTLRIYRSWTGFCIYELEFHRSGSDWVVTSCRVNRDSEQYSSSDEAKDVAMLSWLIEYDMLGDANHPSPWSLPDSPIDA